MAKREKSPEEVIAYKAYKKYIGSKEFDKVKEIVLERDNHRCRICGRSDKDTVSGKPVRLQVHHSTYDNLGNELEHLNEVITVCSGCHRYGCHRPQNASRYKFTQSWINKSNNI